MKRILWSMFSLLMLIVGCKEETPQVDPPPPPPPMAFELPAIENKGYDFTAADTDGWEVLWDESFDNDLTDWTVWRGGAFNNELQFYRSSNLFVENDYLYIRQLRGSVSGPTNPFDQTTKAFSFSSGRIESNEEFGPTKNGGTIRMAARIKLPEGEGLWPAFWSYNDPWPTRGELDALEARGGNPSVYQTNFHFGVNEGQLDTNPAAQEFVYDNGSSLADEFHVYELIWAQNTFTVRFDGQDIHTYDVSEFEYVDDFYDKAHRIVLNLAVGGDFFGNLNEADIPNESYMVVDWVKILKQ
ncbi:MAG: glycoside hydrolase family 16 protein [Bacteroidota bacterium]